MQSADEEGRAEEAETLKREQLRKQKEGTQHWEESLASDSESIVSDCSDALLEHRKSAY